MENARALIEKDLHESIELEWKMPVELTAPDGTEQRYSANDPTELLGGQVVYTSKQENPQTGEVIVVDEPVVTLRVSSLSRVPANGENWFIRFPESPRTGAPMVSHVLSGTRAIEHNRDLGIIRLYPQKIAQEGAGPVST